MVDDITIRAARRNKTVEGGEEMKRENPAKTFLRQYIGLLARVDALTRAIDQAMERAFQINVTLKEIKVISSPAEHDPMAADVCTAVDATETLRTEKAKADAVLVEILRAIDSVQDEREKAVLTYRYIDGIAFSEIAAKMNYSEPAIFVSHGRALVKINRWLDIQKRGESA